MRVSNPKTVDYTLLEGGSLLGGPQETPTPNMHGWQGTLKRIETESLLTSMFVHMFFVNS